MNYLLVAVVILLTAAANTYETPLQADESKTGVELSDRNIDKRAATTYCISNTSPFNTTSTVNTVECLSQLYIMAFTSGIAGSETALPHNVEILANGYVRHVQLPNLPGTDYMKNKGDLWKINIASFNFPCTCLRIVDIAKVSIVEGNDDRWHIDSIVTLVGANGNFQVLTQDIDVNRSVDGNHHPNYRRFELTFVS